MCKPYTYRIKFLLTGQEYFGVRYAERANPDTFWQTYFTSSLIVKGLVKEYGKEAFEVVSIKVHTTKKEARWYEELFLVSVDAARDPNWLNRHNGGLNFTFGSTPEEREIASRNAKEFYAKNPEALLKMSERGRKQFESEEARKQMSDIKKRVLAENPQLREVAREAQKAQYSTEEARKAQGDKVREFYKNNPDARTELAKKKKAFYDANPEFKADKGKKHSEYYVKNPEARLAASEKTKRQLEDPNFRKLLSEANKKYWEDENVREAQSERTKAYISDPVNKVRMYVAQATGFAKKANRPFSYIPESHPAHRN
jgi:hypothetical protein